jgi:hypothetical protein
MFELFIDYIKKGGCSTVVMYWCTSVPVTCYRTGTLSGCSTGMEKGEDKKC